MYVTVINNPQGDDYTAHQILSRMFPKQRILFQRRNLSAYVLSALPSPADTGRLINVKHIIDRVSVGDFLDFSIRINPVVSRRNSQTDAKRGVHKAVACNSVTRWLNNKFLKYGFWGDYTVDQENFHESVKKGYVISMASVMVNGTLEVLNPERVKQALIEGIGRGKGLGFGMLHVYDSLTASV